MTTTHPGALRPKTAPRAAPQRPYRPPTILRRAALAVAEALAAWAEPSAREQQDSAGESAELASQRSLRLQEAERRRDAALNQLFMLPRQF